MTVSIGTLQKEIEDLYRKLGTWQKVADHYGVHRVVVWRIVKQNYVPRDNSLRRKLHLPEITIQENWRGSDGRYRKKE